MSWKRLLKFGMLKFTGVYSRKIKAQKKRLIIFSRSPSCLRCVGDSNP